MSVNSSSFLWCIMPGNVFFWETKVAAKLCSFFLSGQAAVLLSAYLCVATNRIYFNGCGSASSVAVLKEFDRLFLSSDLSPDAFVLQRSCKACDWRKHFSFLRHLFWVWAAYFTKFFLTWIVASTLSMHARVNNAGKEKALKHLVPVLCYEGSCWDFKNFE